MRLNINKVTAAVAHFTAADNHSSENLFDDLVRHTDNFLETPAAQIVAVRYELTQEELLLFRELCLKIVDIAMIVEPNAGASTTIDMPRVSAAFALLWSPNGSLAPARTLIDTDVNDAEYAGLSSEEAVVLRALILTADEFVDIDEKPFLQDI